LKEKGETRMGDEFDIQLLLGGKCINPRKKYERTQKDSAEISVGG